ncbi:hypothetical protein GUITHDRAFT_142379 [Guillardia theta CCMP2712]|uniref:Potassium channel domain-containing protein n=1 Tax=Guillardia theta (strain CCMP2712) TaxID=905079 RepID=L1IXI4_GUITC|nr:hypothetical protein GUITHDRAFT_142379 [Guillardia theta CCMP2712]EKX40983.1 hypothetical protein GUITHDRAFT_142379 [Guillardia theta CCMP2712]|eukprot:XP_005827963.1 hypothetical protein GUITHDRAFT_142379 [Guillardia theta CCMP2712]
MEENRKRTELIKEHTVDLLPRLSPRLIVLARQALKDLVLSHKVNLLKVVRWFRPAAASLTFDPENEVYYKHGFCTTSTTLKGLVLLFSIFLVILIVKYHYDRILRMEFSRRRLPGEPIASRKDYTRCFFECFIAMLHCPPFLDVEWESHSQLGEKVIYSSDSIGALLSMFRLFLLTRTLREIVCVHDLNSLLAARLAGVDIKSQVALPRPVRLHIVPPRCRCILWYSFNARGTTGLELMEFSSSVRIGEAPSQPILLHFENCVWLSIVTATTVGYGDLFPLTIIGRISCVLLAFGGMLIANFFTSVFLQWTTPTKVEERFIAVVQSRKSFLQKKIASTRLIQAWWRYYTHFGNGSARSFSFRLDGRQANSMEHENRTLPSQLAQRFGGRVLKATGVANKTSTFIVIPSDDYKMADFSPESTLSQILNLPGVINVRAKKKGACYRSKKFISKESQIEAQANILYSMTLRLGSQLEQSRKQLDDTFYAKVRSIEQRSTNMDNEV